MIGRLGLFVLQVAADLTSAAARYRTSFHVDTPGESPHYQGLATNCHC